MKRFDKHCISILLYIIPEACLVQALLVDQSAYVPSMAHFEMLRFSSHQIAGGKRNIFLVTRHFPVSQDLPNPGHNLSKFLVAEAFIPLYKGSTVTDS